MSRNYYYYYIYIYIYIYVCLEGSRTAEMRQWTKESCFYNKSLRLQVYSSYRERAAIVDDVIKCSYKLCLMTDGGDGTQKATPGGTAVPRNVS